MYLDLSRSTEWCKNLSEKKCFFLSIQKIFKLKKSHFKFVFIFIFKELKIKNKNVTSNCINSIVKKRDLVELILNTLKLINSTEFLKYL